MILIDYKDRRPIYEQIIEKFQQMILCGVLPAGEPMPSVRSLAMELSINPNTIQRAYQELERSGYIISVKGKGSFVNDTQDAAEGKRREVREEFKNCVQKALTAGVSGQELADILQQSLVTKDMTGKEATNSLEQQSINLQSSERQGE